jgi:VanZ like protein
VTRQIKAGLICTALALCLIGFFTLRPIPEQAAAVAETSPWCIVGCGDLGLLDIILNLLLFIPLGVGLGLVRGTRVAVAIGFLCSVAIELTQFFLIVGRDASLRDVITNTLGTALGASLVTLWRPIVRCEGHTARRLATIAGIAWLGVLAGTSFGAQPSLPQSTWYGQWAPELGQFDTFPGTVRDVHLNKIFLPSGILTNGTEVRETLLTRRFLLSASAVSEGSTEHEAPIFSIFDDQQQEILVLAQAGQAIHFRTRTRAADLELRSLSFRLERFPTTAGTPVEIAVLRDGPSLSLSIESAQGKARWTSRTTVGSGWAMLLPWEYASGPEAALGSFMWLGGLLIPAGYWAGRCGAGRAMPLFLLATIAVGLLVIPRMFGMGTSPWSEWVGSVVGAATGWFVGRATTGNSS